MYSKFLWNINFIQNRTLHVLFFRLFFFPLELCYGIFSELNCIFFGNHFNYLKVISFWRKNNFRLYLKFNEYTWRSKKQYNFLFQTRVCESLPSLLNWRVADHACWYWRKKIIDMFLTCWPFCLDLEIKSGKIRPIG